MKMCITDHFPGYSPRVIGMAARLATTERSIDTSKYNANEIAKWCMKKSNRNIMLMMLVVAQRDYERFLMNRLIKKRSEEGVDFAITGYSHRYFKDALKDSSKLVEEIMCAEEATR